MLNCRTFFVKPPFSPAARSPAGNPVPAAGNPARRSLFLWLFIFSAPIFAQSAAEMETLRQKEAITFGEAAAWVYAATGLYPPGVQESEAMDFALANREIPKNAGEKDIIKLNDLSLLIVKAFGIRGGLMYRLLQNRRYAFRELVHLGILEKSDDPSDNVSGEHLLEILKKFE